MTYIMSNVWYLIPGSNSFYGTVNRAPSKVEKRERELVAKSGENTIHMHLAHDK